MDVVGLERYGTSSKRVAYWNSNSRLQITRSVEELQSEKAQTLQTKVFKVISKLGMPYLREVESEQVLTGNDRYEGFIKDFMDAIAKVKNLTYKLELEPTGHYGHHDPHTGKWDGIVGDIVDGVCIVLHVYV